MLCSKHLTVLSLAPLVDSIEHLLYVYNAASHADNSELAELYFKDEQLFRDELARCYAGLPGE